ncbi:MAG: hypothetical protein E7075_06340 [Bacteroidales bacterium]|nr:hypothetical protein [Bacteroidales bacterium]
MLQEKSHNFAAELINSLRYGRKATPRKKQKAKDSTLFRDCIYLPHHRLRADMVGATFYKLKT